MILRPSPPWAWLGQTPAIMKKAALVFFGAIAGLAIALGVVGRPDKWPPLESPPRQGEALDVRLLQSGQFTHSAPAISRLIREPQNTWSNLAFILAGALLLGRVPSRSGGLVGAALVAVGIGSFLYHASASRALRHLDVGAMNGLFFVTIVLVGAHFRGGWREKVESHPGMVAFAALGFALLATVARNFVIFGLKPLALTTVTAGTVAILICALVLEAWRSHSVRVTSRVVMAIALFAAAVICQIGDRPGGWLLNPDSPLQAHALWHVLSAAALFVAVKVIDSRENSHPGTNLDRTRTGAYGSLRSGK